MNESDVYAALMAAWNLPPAGASQLCRSRLPEGLQCLRGRGGLEDLRSMDLPAILHLVDPAGRRVDALLIAATGASVVLWIRGRERLIAPDDLAVRWRGDYTLLWRAPPAFERPLQAGQRGAAVDWLRDRLAQLEGARSSARRGLPFDRPLAERLRRFQVAEGLDPDGVGGARTLARLSARTDRAQPRLSMPRARKGAQEPALSMLASAMPVR